jgi:hypothetical protein
MRVRAASNAIPNADHGSLSVDEFCDLPARANIEEAIRAEERSLAASQQADSVRTTPAFEVLNVPDFNIAALTALLMRDMPTLDAEAVRRVQEHLEIIAAGAKREYRKAWR